MNKKASIDWAKWQAIPGVNLPSVQLWEACAMSLNIAPDTLEFSGNAWMNGSGNYGPSILKESFPNSKAEKTFHARLNMLLENLSNRKLFTPGTLSMENSYSNKVRMDEFAAFALRCSWTIPKQMRKLATPPTTKTIPEPQVTGTTAPVELAKAPQAKPLQRTAAQDAAILSEIKKQGFSPLALPKNPAGKPGVKAAIRTALLQHSLFAGSTVFDKAWERLTVHADIMIQG